MVLIISDIKKILVPQMGSMEPKPAFEYEDQSLVGPDKHSLDEAPLRSLYSGGPGDCSPQAMGNTVVDSIKIVVFSAKINLLMPFGPLAIVVDKFSGHRVSFLFLFLHVNCSDRHMIVYLVI